MSLERFTRKRLVALGPGATLREAADLMRRTHVGAVVITRGRRPVGILTDRDLALRAVAAGATVDTPVSEVMSGDLVVARASETLDEAFGRMRRSGVRRLPIVDGRGRLVGLVALDDLLVLLAAELSLGARTVLDNRGP
jgi:CBS domain-containing protein